MLNRILDISETGARLRLHLEQLVVETGDREQHSIPLTDLSVIVVAHPQVTFSAAVVAAFMRFGGVIVFSHPDCRPAGMLLPLEGHSTQQERFERQASAPVPLRKRLWQSIVQAKIRHQSSLLTELHGQDFGLGMLAAKVRSGDRGNAESVAAVRYWPRLFNDPGFRRGRDGLDPNPLLNYGYAILRAVVARAICAAGLHPSLGLHHANRYNAFVLADDLMEPFRPLVDRAVASLVLRSGLAVPLDRSSKQVLIGSILRRYRHDGESRTLFDWLSLITASLAQVFEGRSSSLFLPALEADDIPRKDPLRVQGHVAVCDLRSAG
jgi:CRISPR-associated protein Cas1